MQSATRRWSRMWKRLTALPVILITVSGCASDTRVTDSSCAVFAPITHSSRDTAETVEQIVTHNAKWDSVCD